MKDMQERSIAGRRVESGTASILCAVAISVSGMDAGSIEELLLEGHCL
jgi:hypothetical protein